MNNAQSLTRWQHQASYISDRLNQAEEEIKTARDALSSADLDPKEESMSNWVNVDEQPFPDKDGVVVCWDGQEYIAFYFRSDWTVELPFGTKCWYLVPHPDVRPRAR